MKKKKTPDSLAAQVLSASFSAFESCLDGKTLDDVLDLSGNRHIRPQLANTMFFLFRHLGAIDDAIAKLVRRRTKSSHTSLLRVTAAMAAASDGVRPEVVVSLAVDFAKKRFGSGGFINAVARKLVADGNDFQGHLPENIEKRWKQRLGEDKTAELARLFTAAPPLSFRLAKGIETDNLPAELESAEIAPEKWNDKFRFRRIIGTPAVLFENKLPEQGFIYIQDPSTALPACVAEPINEGLIIDLCAAPGGKTIMLAELCPNTKIIAADRSEKRLERAAANFAAHGLEIETVVTDATRNQFPADCADIVLVDAPCSNTGVFRRKPDALWRFNNASLAAAVELQGNILANAANIVKPGGQLIYSTCSLEPEENSAQTAEFIARHPEFSIASEKLLLPSQSHDGGYAAKLIKNADANPSRR